MRDVNAEFASQRATQIQNTADRLAYLDSEVEKGSMVKLSDGRYRVLTGWDRGEILSAQGLPQDGLDLTEDGRKALYTSEPAWNSLATPIPAGMNEIDGVLQVAGLDWTTELRQVRYSWMGNDLTPEIREAPGSFVTVRSDTGAPLGVVGSQYTPLQNRAAFEFLQDLVQDYNVPFSTAGSFRGGSKVFVSMEVPSGVTIDADGVGDHIRMFLLAINTHDGSGAWGVSATPWRPVCRNTERLAVQHAVTSWRIRHTRNATARVDEARRTLSLTTEYMRRFQAEQEQLIRTDMYVDDFQDVINGLWAAPEDGAATRAVSSHAKRRDTLTGLFTMESERCGRNAYAAERAITGYLDHFIDLKPRNDLKGNALAALGQAILEGSQDKAKNNAHKRLMAFVTR